MGLTPKQLRALDFIRDFIRERGYSPTLSEIASGLGLSKPGAQVLVRALRKAGAIRKKRYAHRSIEPVALQQAQARAGLKLLGIVAAGSPIEAIEEPEEVHLGWEGESRGGELYALLVRGDSMVEDGIFDGDYVVVEARHDARDGETVVAMLDDGTVTLKKLYREPARRRVRLEARNPEVGPIYARDVRIRGVVRAVVRRV